ncbi:hypothetical protein KDA00_05815 [Candidatus Saccharibacteria bacterium]|nr:hypothetical protein [Candidatus Saccharibacteria bacterium]
MTTSKRKNDWERAHPNIIKMGLCVVAGMVICQGGLTSGSLLEIFDHLIEKISSLDTAIVLALISIWEVRRKRE